MIPMQQVLDRCVSPVHVIVINTMWIKLIIEVVQPVLEEHAVGVVYPHILANEMKHCAQMLQLIRKIVALLSHLLLEDCAELPELHPQVLCEANHNASS